MAYSRKTDKISVELFLFFSFPSGNNKSTANGAPLVSYAVVVNEHLKRHISPSVFLKNQPIDLDLDRLGRAGWTEWSEWA